MTLSRVGGRCCQNPSRDINACVIEQCIALDGVGRLCTWIGLAGIEPVEVFGVGSLDLATVLQNSGVEVNEFGLIEAAIFAVTLH